MLIQNRVLSFSFLKPIPIPVLFIPISGVLSNSAAQTHQEAVPNSSVTPVSTLLAGH